MSTEKHISFENLRVFKSKLDDWLKKRINDGINNTIDLTEYAKKSDVVTACKYRGKKDTYADLLAIAEADRSVGDIWNVSEADKDNNVDAGDNFVWNGEEWDNLSGIVDLSKLQEKEEGKSLLADTEIARLLEIEDKAQANKIEVISVDDEDIAIVDKKVNIVFDTKIDEKLEAFKEDNSFDFASNEDIESLFYTKKSMTNSQNLADFFGVYPTIKKYLDVDGYENDYCVRFKRRSDNTEIAVQHGYGNDEDSKAYYLNGIGKNYIVFSFKLNDTIVNVLSEDILDYSCFSGTIDSGNLQVTDINGNTASFSSSAPETKIRMTSNNLSVLAQRINDTNSCFKADYTNGVFSIINTDGDDFVISNTEGSKIDVASKLVLS